MPGSPAWVRVAGGVGRYTPEQASVGATYDYRRGEVEAGLDVELGPGLTGTLSVLHVQGSGDVSSPTGGGEISARGLGGALGVGWLGPRGYYFRGRVSVLDYDVDLTADRRRKPGTIWNERARWRPTGPCFPARCCRRSPSKFVNSTTAATSCAGNRPRARATTKWRN